MWTAAHPLGPWNYTGVDINPQQQAHQQRPPPQQGSPTSTSTSSDSTRSDSSNGRAANAQESFVFLVPPPSNNGTAVAEEEGTFVFVGDRWTSAPDHLKSHDLQFWYPLSFHEIGDGVDGVVCLLYTSPSPRDRG